MNIRVYYDNGRLDEFDVEHFTVSEPFDGRNMLTNFELRFDELGKESLWLQAHFYDVRDEYREGVAPEAVPVARRMKGWRFLLVDKSEIGRVAKIIVNGELVAWRQGPDLVNGIRFDAQERACYSDDVTSSVSRRAVALHDYLAAAHSELAADEDALCAMFGFTKRAFESVLDAEQMQPVQSDGDGTDWMDEDSGEGETR